MFQSIADCITDKFKQKTINTGSQGGVPRIGLNHILMSVFLIGVAFASLYCFGRSMVALSDDDQIDIERFADDPKQEYRLAQRGGNKKEMCIDATAVLALYPDKREMGQFTEWQETQIRDCEKAHLPLSTAVALAGEKFR